MNQLLPGYAAKCCRVFCFVKCCKSMFSESLEKYSKNNWGNVWRCYVHACIFALSNSETQSITIKNKRIMDNFQKFLETEANAFGLNAETIITVNQNPELLNIWQGVYRDHVATKVVVTNFSSGSGVTPYGEVRDADSLSRYASAVKTLGEPTRSEKSDFRTSYFWDK